MARKTIKEQLHEIEQGGGRPEPGYVYNPRTEPRLFKKRDDRAHEEVASELPAVAGVVTEDEGDGDGE